MTWKPHPLTRLIPAPSDADRALLKARIEAAGRIFVPIVLYRGMIVDGCTRAGIWAELLRAGKVRGAMPTAEYDGRPEDLAAWIYDMNVPRRHLTTSQRAFIAARLMAEEKEQAKARMEATQAKPGEKANERNRGVANLPPPKNTEETATCGKAREKAAARCNVSPRLVQAAVNVIAQAAPAVVAAVEAGAITVHAADQIRKLSVADQAAALNAETAKVRGQAKARERREAADAAAGHLAAAAKLAARLAKARKKALGLDDCGGIVAGVDRVLADLRRLYPSLGG